MTHYFKTANKINVYPSDSVEILTYLPVDTYQVKFDPMRECLYLQTAERLKLPSKIYGDVGSRVDRVMKTFADRVRNTGVLLSGEKGTGKTIMAKAVCDRAIENNIPVLMINEAFSGQRLTDLISNLKKSVVIFIDEFDKVYSEEDSQQSLLSLMDGTAETKHMYLLTANKGHIDEHMLNRPGRIYYHFKYSGVESSFLAEYCKDKVLNQEHIPSVISLRTAFPQFTFDMLQSVVEEMNRFDIDALSAVKGMNLDVTRYGSSYKVTVLYDGKPISNTFWPTYFEANPMVGHRKSSIDITFDNKKTFTDSDGEDFPELYVSRETFSKYLGDGEMMFNSAEYNGKKIQVVLSAISENLNWMDAL